MGRPGDPNSDRHSGVCPDGGDPRTLRPLGLRGGLQLEPGVPRTEVAGRKRKPLRVPLPCALPSGHALLRRLYCGRSLPSGRSAWRLCLGRIDVPHTQLRGRNLAQALTNAVTNIRAGSLSPGSDVFPRTQGDSAEETLSKQIRALGGRPSGKAEARRLLDDA